MIDLPFAFGGFYRGLRPEKDSMKKLLKGQPSLIIRNGEWDMKQMKNNHLDLEQVRTMLSSGSA